MNLTNFKDFTPGPWEARSHTSSLFGGGPERTEIVIYTKANVRRSRHIAKITSETPEPDAHLVAAAPDLLAECRRLKEENGRLREILKSFAGRHEGWEQGMGQCVCKWHEKARAALRENQGEG